MQVDDEHLSLTDQKDQVREPLPPLSWEPVSQAGTSGASVYAKSPAPLLLQDAPTSSVRQAGCLGE